MLLFGAAAAGSGSGGGGGGGARFLLKVCDDDRDIAHCYGQLLSRVSVYVLQLRPAAKQKSKGFKLYSGNYIPL